MSHIEFLKLCRNEMTANFSDSLGKSAKLKLGGDEVEGAISGIDAETCQIKFTPNFRTSGDWHYPFYLDGTTKIELI